MTNFSPGWNISLRTKYEIASKESRENQAAILFPAFQRGLKILARFNQTRLGFSARAELHPGLNSSPPNRQFDFKSRAGISARLNSSCNQAFTRISIIPRSFIHCWAKQGTKYMNPTINVHTIIPRSFIHCRAKRAAKYMDSARHKNFSTAEPNEPLNIWTQHLTRVQLVLLLVLSPTAEPNEPARLVNV